MCSWAPRTGFRASLTGFVGSTCGGMSAGEAGWNNALMLIDT